MPVYEYECKECGVIFEAEQRIIDPPLTTCRYCGGSVERLISRCSFVLKGDGWYVTDYPSKDRKRAIEKRKKINDKSDSKETKGKNTQEKPKIKKETTASPSPAASSPA